MKYYIYYLFTIIIILLSGCMEFFNVPKDKDGYAWGFKSAEKIVPLEFKEEKYSLEIDYKARMSSKKYGVRLVFPYINRENNSNYYYKLIHRQFNGFSCKVFDLQSHCPIDSFFNIPKSYLGRDSLVACLPFNLFLKKNKTYRFTFQIPKKIDDNIKMQGIKMAIGTEYAVTIW